jgi:DNA gyrase inhibitor GyrI
LIQIKCLQGFGANWTVFVDALTARHRPSLGFSLKFTRLLHGRLKGLAVTFSYYYFEIAAKAATKQVNVTIKFKRFIVTSGFVYLRPVPVMFVRTTGPYGKSADQAWDQMLNWLTENGLRDSTKNGYGLMHDDPRTVPVEQCRYDACAEVPSEMFNAAPDHFSMCYLPGGAFSRKRHKGMQKDLGPAIVEMRDSWLPQHDLALDSNRPMITIFYDDPLIVPDGKRRIDICAPIKIQAEGTEDRSAA